MAEKSWNKNVRFNRNSESAMQAWSLLHSDEVEKEFKSQNEFVICAINDYYERHLRKKRDPYLETREKEDAFVERIVAQVAEKTLANLPTLAGMYLIQQQAVLTAGFQSTVAGANAGMPVMPSPANGNGNAELSRGILPERFWGNQQRKNRRIMNFLITALVCKAKVQKILWDEGYKAGKY